MLVHGRGRRASAEVDSVRLRCPPFTSLDNPVSLCGARRDGNWAAAEGAVRRFLKVPSWAGPARDPARSALTASEGAGI